MELYKIGLDVNNLSPLLNNGGFYEYQKVKEVLDTIDCDDFICVLNGVGNTELPKGKRKIFIATDDFCFTENMDVINSCDYVLHQSEQRLEFVHKPQEFSYMPFLFASHEPKSAVQIPRVIFGGASRGRDDKINRYIMRCDQFNPDVVPFLKLYDKDGKAVFDNRIDYDSFIHVMRSYKFTLCFSRKNYDCLKWVTPRYMESASCYTLPLVDYTYTTHSSFAGLTTMVRNADDMRCLVLSMTEEERMDHLAKLQYVIKAHSDSFRDIILKIIG